MKTGRVRSKEPAPAEEPRAVAPPLSEEAPPPAAPAAPTPAPGGLSVSRLVWVIVAAGAVIACVVLALLLLRGRGGAEEWVAASRANGNWATAVQVFGPQVQLRETWQTDCQNRQGVVQQPTCVLRDTGRWQDQPVDQYEEYAYNIYYDETWKQVYEAQGTEFVKTALGSDDRVEGNRRYLTQERLKDSTCQLTEYTVWVDDPANASQEIEVYLHECEVWDQVRVFEQVQAPWCQCQVTTIAPLGQPLTQQGAGVAVAWPQAQVPSGGRIGQSFEGTVTFVGGDYTYTVSTTDPAQYADWLQSPYYLGIRDGQVVTLSKAPGE